MFAFATKLKVVIENPSFQSAFNFISNISITFEIYSVVKNPRSSVDSSKLINFFIKFSNSKISLKFKMFRKEAMRIDCKRRKKITCGQGRMERTEVREGRREREREKETVAETKRSRRRDGEREKKGSNSFSFSSLIRLVNRLF